MATGFIAQVIGSTFDAEFEEQSIPAIFNALKVTLGSGRVLVGEVQQHLGAGRVRCVALASTDGLVRGTAVEDTGAPVSMPVGPGVLGRVFNVLGDAIDSRGPVKAEEYRPIHHCC